MRISVTFSPALGIVSAPDFGYFNRCVEVSYYYFNRHLIDMLIDMMTYDVGYFFICSVDTCISFLVKYLLTSLARIYILIN